MRLSYSQKLYYRAIGKLLIPPAIAFALSFILTWFVIEQMFAFGMPLMIFCFAIGFVFYPLNQRIQKWIDGKIDPIYSKFETPLLEERDAAKLGMEGERVVKEWLANILPKDGWEVLWNLERKNGNYKKFDIDCVVVGPKGVFVFEIKNYSYDYIFTTEDCAVVSGEKIVKSDSLDPRTQVRLSAERIESELKQNGIEVRTKRAVVFARPNSIRYLGKTGVFLVDNMESLKRFILDTPEEPNITEETRKRIVATLS